MKYKIIVWAPIGAMPVINLAKPNLTRLSQRDMTPLCPIFEEIY